jgi:hypothetical protein
MTGWDGFAICKGCVEKKIVYISVKVQNKVGCVFHEKTEFQVAKGFIIASVKIQEGDILQADHELIDEFAFWEKCV